MQQAYSYPDRSTTVETTTVDDGSDGSIEQTVVRTQTIA